jgi:proteasome lid subunit RPN8/RPN11
VTEAIQVRVLGRATLAPTPRRLPLFDASFGELRTEGAVRGDGLQTYVVESTMVQLLRHARSDPTHEIGGWLFGEYAIDGDWPFVIVTQHLPARGRAPNGAAFHLTIEDQEEAESYRRAHPELHAVGWYHSHPIGLRFSEQDRGVHRGLFRQAHHIALVMWLGGRTGEGGRIGCVSWNGDRLTEAGGFFVLPG